MGHRISHALVWSHLTPISAHLYSRSRNKAYLKKKDVYRRMNPGHVARLRCDFTEALETAGGKFS